MPPRTKSVSCTLAALAALALVATLAAPAASAEAGELLIVDGDRMVATHDPHLPPAVAGDLPPVPARSARGLPPRAFAATSRAVVGALVRARRAGRISRARYLSYRRIYRRARSTRTHLQGARRRELSSVIATLEQIARRGRLTSSRMPALFLQLARNSGFWRSSRFPAARARIAFRGSQLVFQYFPGAGLQIQPLVNFVRANRLHGACEGVVEAPCRRQALGTLVDELIAVSSARGPFRAWEYYFHFGGGSPPWVSGMAQATGIQALARASKLLRRPRYLRFAARTIGVFGRRPPLGVRVRGPDGGTHFLQYSFAPRLFILNAFLQSLNGLYDYYGISRDERARALFRAGDREGRLETPHHDTGDWSLYSRGGRESDRGYHVLLRDVLRGLCLRKRAEVYCGAARRFTGYARDPAKLTFLGPDRARVGSLTRVRFRLSKLSKVAVRITKDGRVFRRVHRFRRGSRAFLWRPRSRGAYSVKLVAKELRTGRYLKATIRASVQAE